MFFHIFTNRLKCLLRDRMMIFWTLLFPILLAVFFNMSLRNIASSETFRPVPTAVVNDAGYQKNAGFRSALKSVSEGKDKIFSLTETTRKNAEKLLEDGKIAGYLTVGDKIKIVVNRSDFDQSIIKSFVDSYLQTSSAAESILKANPPARSGLIAGLSGETDYLKAVSGGSADPDPSLNYFYSLIAMACLYGGFWGMKEVMDIQANQSQRAARVNLAPVRKLKTFLSGMAASLAIAFAEMLALLAFLRFALNLDFGPKAGLVIFTSFVGSVVGLSFGAFLSSLVKAGENMKVGILISGTMFCSFLSGMMYQDMKYIVEKNAPVLGYLNPVNLLTDSFYCLYYYDTYGRYLLNIGLLGAFVLLFCAGTYFVIRREKYASL